MKPVEKPGNPCFGSGPCAKRPGWDLTQLSIDWAGRSHRSSLGSGKLKEIIDRTRALLKIPDDYKIGITPASDTGAVEMALWNLLGPVGVDVFAWERFSRLWLEDITESLRLPDVRCFEATYGQLPDMVQMYPDRDAVFAWNGTTSGACIPEGFSWPKATTALRICDATSAIFAYKMPWQALDVVTWSWQKCMGGEAQHGIIVLSPKALQRLQTHTPSWPVPKIFRLQDESGKLNQTFFEGATINTPSLLCVEDALDSLRWMENIGGQEAVERRIVENAKTLDAWVQRTPWIDYLVTDPAIRSRTSVCLRLTDPSFTALSPDEQARRIGALVANLEAEKVAYDIKSYKTAPLGLRIWCGATVESPDIALLTAWLDWAYSVVN